MFARCAAVLSVLLLFQTPAYCSRDRLPVYPVQQEIELTDARLDLSSAKVVYFNGPEGRLSELAAQLSSELAARYMLPLQTARACDYSSGTQLKICLGLSSDPEIRRLLDYSAPVGEQQWDSPEGYRVLVKSDGAVIAGHDLRGLFYGIQSFIQLTESSAPRKAVACGADIRDWPFKPIRGVHVYLPARGDLPFFMNYIRTMAHYKINTIILEVGGGMRLDSHPEVNTAWELFCRDFYDMGDPFLKYGEQVPLGPKNRFQASVHTELGGGSWLSKEEVRRIAACARANGIDLVPEIQSLTHAYYLVLGNREIAEIPEADYPDSYDPANEKSYEILFDVIDEYLEVLQPEWVHIGHDEWRTGLMPDPGQAFAGDVLKIYGYLQSRGVKTMMWADHVVEGHNMMGRAPAEQEEGVWYCYPSTASAREVLAEHAPDILMLNWSWGVDPSSDQQLREHGWKQIFGNFSGARSYDKWHARLAAPGILGAEMSTWCLADELSYGQNGALLNMLFSQNLLWSNEVQPAEKLFEHIAAVTPEIREALSGARLPSREVALGRPGYGFRKIDLSSRGNAGSVSGDQSGLENLSPGTIDCRGIPFTIGHGAKRFAVVGGGRQQVRGIPVGDNAASLLFLHVSTGKARKRNTYFSNYPEDTAILLGCYRVRYADGLELTVPVRYGRNICHASGSFADQVYFTHTVDLAGDSGGKPCVAYAYEWVNPRPNRVIENVDLVAVDNEAKAYPALLGLTTVTLPFDK